MFTWLFIYSPPVYIHPCRLYFRPLVRTSNRSRGNNWVRNADSGEIPLNYYPLAGAIVVFGQNFVWEKNANRMDVFCCRGRLVQRVVPTLLWACFAQNVHEPMYNQPVSTLYKRSNKCVTSVCVTCIRVLWECIILSYNTRYK